MFHWRFSYSSLARGSLFFEAPVGTLIIVKGRLEAKEGVGLLVINEIDEIYLNKSGIAKTKIAEQ